MHKITILPHDKIIEVQAGANLRTSLISDEHNIKSPCGGCASCGQCIVIVEAGDKNLNDIPFEEKQLLGNVFHITKERLSCQTTVHGDITVNIEAHMEKEANKSKTIRRDKEKQDEIRENKIGRPPKEGGWRRPKGFKTED